VLAGWFRFGYLVDRIKARSLDSHHERQKKAKRPFNDTEAAESRRRPPAPPPDRSGILTAGGDAPGMTPRFAPSVRAAANAEVYVFGFRRGYDGLIKDLAER